MLGQPHLRQRYDRKAAGVHVGKVRAGGHSNFRASRSSVYTDRTKYDYDEWYKQQYGAATKKRERRRAERRQEARDMKNAGGDYQTMTVFLGASAAMVYFCNIAT